MPSEKVRLLPNFLEPDPGIGDVPRKGILFVGRLSEEKGVPVLVRAAAFAPGLVSVAGRGPLSPLVEAAALAGDLAALGYLEKGAVFTQMRASIAMVLPSVWFEGMPVSVLEAYATGTPVIASGIGSLAELVTDGVTGLLAKPGDERDLADRLLWADGHPGEMRKMGANARREYETKYRGGVHLAGLLDTYQRLIEAAAGPA